MKPPPSFLLTKKKWGPTTLQTVAPSVKVAPGKPVFGPWEVGVLPFRNLENRPYQGTTSKTLGHVWDVFCCEVCNPITRIFLLRVRHFLVKMNSNNLDSKELNHPDPKDFSHCRPKRRSHLVRKMDSLWSAEHTFLGCWKRWHSSGSGRLISSLPVQDVCLRCDTKNQIFILCRTPSCIRHEKAQIMFWEEKGCVRLIPEVVR